MPFPPHPNSIKYLLYNVRVSCMGEHVLTSLAHLAPLMQLFKNTCHNLMRDYKNFNLCDPMIG